MTEEPRATLVERLLKAAEDFEGCRDWHGNHEDGDCEPHWSAQQEMDDAAKVAREAAAALSLRPAETRVKELRWEDEDMAMHWIDRYAAGIDADPQMDRILDCVEALSEPARAEEGKEPVADTLCSDCPPVGYPTDKTRCLPCPRRTLEITEEAVEAVGQAIRWACDKHWTGPHLPFSQMGRAALEASLPFLSQTGGEKSDGWRAEMDKLWRMFVVQCESIEDRETPTSDNEHEMGFYRGEKSAAKSIRRSVEHPKYNSADFPIYAGREAETNG